VCVCVCLCYRVPNSFMKISIKVYLNDVAVVVAVVVVGRASLIVAIVANIYLQICS